MKNIPILYNNSPLHPSGTNPSNHPNASSSALAFDAQNMGSVTRELCLSYSIWITEELSEEIASDAGLPVTLDTKPGEVADPEVLKIAVSEKIVELIIKSFGTKWKTIQSNEGILQLKMLVKQYASVLLVELVPEKNVEEIRQKLLTDDIRILESGWSKRLSSVLKLAKATSSQKEFEAQKQFRDQSNSKIAELASQYAVVTNNLTLLSAQVGSFSEAVKDLEKIPALVTLFTNGIADLKSTIGSKLESHESLISGFVKRMDKVEKDSKENRTPQFTNIVTETVSHKDSEKPGAGPPVGIDKGSNSTGASDFNRNRVIEAVEKIKLPKLKNPLELDVHLKEVEACYIAAGVGSGNPFQPIATGGMTCLLKLSESLSDYPSMETVVKQVARQSGYDWIQVVKEVRSQFLQRAELKRCLELELSKLVYTSPAVDFLNNATKLYISYTSYHGSEESDKREIIEKILSKIPKYIKSKVEEQLRLYQAEVDAKNWETCIPFVPVKDQKKSVIATIRTYDNMYQDASEVEDDDMLKKIEAAGGSWKERDNFTKAHKYVYRVRGGGQQIKNKTLMKTKGLEILITEGKYGSINLIGSKTPMTNSEAAEILGDNQVVLQLWTPK